MGDNSSSDLPSTCRASSENTILLDAAIHIIISIAAAAVVVGELGRGRVRIRISSGTTRRRGGRRSGSGVWLVLGLVILYLVKGQKAKEV